MANLKFSVIRRDTINESCLNEREKHQGGAAQVPLDPPVVESYQTAEVVQSSEVTEEGSAILNKT